MAPATRQPDDAVPPAAAVRALRDAIVKLGRQFGYGQHENASTVIHLLGASIEDTQALYEYLRAFDAGDPEGSPS